MDRHDDRLEPIRRLSLPAPAQASAGRRLCSLSRKGMPGAVQINRASPHRIPARRAAAPRRPSSPWPPPCSPPLGICCTATHNGANRAAPSPTAPTQPRLPTTSFSDNNRSAPVMPMWRDPIRRQLFPLSAPRRSAPTGIVSFPRKTPFFEGRFCRKLNLSPATFLSEPITRATNPLAGLVVH